MKTNSKLIAIFLSLLIFSTSCTQYDDAAELSETTSDLKSTTQMLSGQKMFTGLFFLQNSIADDLTFLKPIKENLKNQKVTKQGSKQNAMFYLSNFSKETVSFINKKYPGFFEEFKKTLQSGNLYSIEKIMNKSVKIIEQAGLSSKMFPKEFAISRAIQNDDETMKKILNLDLTQEKDMLELENLLNQVSYTDDLNSPNRGFLVVIAAALAYIVVAAVSFVVAAYSVAVEAAYWDNYLNSKSNLNNSQTDLLEKELVLAEIGNYFK